jgi:hypothetical protein
VLVPLLVLFHPNQKTVISTEAAHAFVSSAAEKSASLPPPFTNPRSVPAFAVAFLVVIPKGDLLLPLPLFHPATTVPGLLFQYFGRKSFDWNILHTNATVKL